MTRSKPTRGRTRHITDSLVGIRVGRHRPLHAALVQVCGQRIDAELAVFHLVFDAHVARPDALGCKLSDLLIVEATLQVERLQWRQVDRLLGSFGLSRGGLGLRALLPGR